MVWPGDQRRVTDNVDVSPDGKLAVIELGDTGLSIVRLDDGTRRELRPLGDYGI